MLNMTDFMSLRWYATLPSLRHANGIRAAASYLVALARYSWLYLATSWYSLKTSLRRFNTDLLLD